MFADRVIRPRHEHPYRLSPISNLYFLEAGGTLTQFCRQQIARKKIFARLVAGLVCAGEDVQDVLVKPGDEHRGWMKGAQRVLGRTPVADDKTLGTVPFKQLVEPAPRPVKRPQLFARSSFSRPMRGERTRLPIHGSARCSVGRKVDRPNDYSICEGPHDSLVVWA